MALILAGLSSVLFGGADFTGGLASKRAPVLSVVLLSQTVGLVLLVLVLPFAGGDGSPSTDMVWGLGAGVLGAVGLIALYRGLATQQMTTVAPVAALVGATVPVVFGLGVGERPTVLALTGVIVSLPAIYLISVTDKERLWTVAGPALRLGFLAGAMFGGFFILISRTGDASGMWPLFAARLGSVALMAALAVATRRPAVPPRRVFALVALAGVLDMAANILFLVAVRDTLLSLVAVVTSLYPASTILLARVWLNERINHIQAGGLIAAAGAAVMIALG